MPAQAPMSEILDELALVSSVKKGLAKSRKEKALRTNRLSENSSQGLPNYGIITPVSFGEHPSEA
jgi:hypothetical protein